MRSLEWAFLLSFIPILLTPLISQQWRHRWIVVSALLPIVIGIGHLATEGWRVQLLPAYFIAVGIFVSRMAELQRHKTVVQPKRGVLLNSLIALTLVLCGVLAGWVLPIAALPEPTGPYSVGIIDRELVDEERGRRLMASIWYPADETGTFAPLTQHPDAVAKALGNLTGLPGLPFQQLQYFTTHATANVAIASEAEPFPVLVFSHGMVGLRLQNSPMLQELASWGYIVVAIDHTDAAAVTVFPDGEARFYDLERFGIPDDVEVDKRLMNEYVFPVWVADQRFVYDTLETWQANDPLLAGRLDLTKIGSFGHSFGGATALEVCRVDARCQAAVNLDGALYGDTASHPSVRPLLLMTSAESQEYEDAVDEWTALIEQSDNAYWLELPHSTHLSFTITQLLSPILVPPHFDAREGLHTIDKYLRLFFDSYLRENETKPFWSVSGGTDVRWLSNEPK